MFELGSSKMNVLTRRPHMTKKGFRESSHDQESFYGGIVYD